MASHRFLRSSDGKIGHRTALLVVRLASVHVCFSSGGPPSPRSSSQVQASSRAGSPLLSPGVLVLADCWKLHGVETVEPAVWGDRLVVGGTKNEEVSGLSPHVLSFVLLVAELLPVVPAVVVLPVYPPEAGVPAAVVVLGVAGELRALETVQQAVWVDRFGVGDDDAQESSAILRLFSPIVVLVAGLLLVSAVMVIPVDPPVADDVPAIVALPVVALAKEEEEEEAEEGAIGDTPAAIAHGSPPATSGW